MNTYHTYATLGRSAPLLPVEVTIESETPITVSDLTKFLYELSAETPEEAADKLVERFDGASTTVTARINGVDITASRIG